jgi:hypothetical protein
VFSKMCIIYDTSKKYVRKFGDLIQVTTNAGAQ